MVSKRKLYPIKIGRCGKYRYKSTSGHDTGVVIFIQKRLFGFLWWTLVRDKNGCPITYNHFLIAAEFMKGNIGYYDNISYESGYDENGKISTTARQMTDELAWEKITKAVQDKTGETPELDCVKKAWEFDKKQYIHVATQYAILWDYIFKSNGKKLWMN